MIIKADEPNVDWSSFPVNIIGESYGMFYCDFRLPYCFA